MLKQWIGCAPGNARVGRKTDRDTFTPEAIVLHQLDSMAEADRRFADPAAGESAHYAVSEDGVVHQYVEEADTAFHAGVVVNGSWTGLKVGQNPNFYTIGIVGAAKSAPWSGGLYDALAQLIADVASRWHIPLDAAHVVLHSEIRAPKMCPGPACDRAEILKRLPAAAANSHVVFSPSIVRVIATTNLREGAPSSQARIVSTLAAGADVEVVGFTDAGERIQGNAIWYQTREDRYLWAGNTSAPQPVVPAPVTPPAPAPPAPGAVRACGIPKIDALVRKQPGSSIARAETDRAAVGAVQDLLAGQGYSAMPGLLSPAYGKFGNQTVTAVQDFQARQGLPVIDAVDADLLERLVTLPAPEPRITQVYMTLALGLDFQGMQKVVSIVAQMEGVGKFGALNLNTDKAGLSYGLIQWAQKPGRLAELLRVFSQANRDLYVSVFGEGDARVADALLAFTSGSNGGVNASGATTDPRFDLVADPWVGRFRRATTQREFQRAQVDAALRAFTASYRRVLTLAPDVRSERGAAFMLDVANQFGDGGLRRICTMVRRPGMTEMDLLEAIADETVAEMPDHFQRGVRDRRDSFLHTALLNDQAADLVGG